MEPRKVPKLYWVIMRPKILNFIYKLCLLDLTLDDIQQYKLFPTEPNLSLKYKKFMKLVKSGQVSLARDVLFEDRFLVYHFDFVNFDKIS